MYFLHFDNVHKKCMQHQVVFLTENDVREAQNTFLNALSNINQPSKFTSWDFVIICGI